MLAEIGLEDMVEEVPEDSELWWSVERAGYLFGQMGPNDQAIAVRMIIQERYRYGMILRQIRFGESRVELRTDRMIGGETGSLCGERILFKAGKGRYFVRQLTPRECARLMGADDYRVTGPENQALIGIEDAVCVPVIQWIARYYLNPLVCELLRGRPIRTGCGRERI